MTLRIGDTAPDFEADTTEGRIRFHEWVERFVVRPVLASERLHAGLHDRTRVHGQDEAEFDKRNVKIIGLSVDPVDNHARWADDIRETQGAAPNYP